MAGDPAAPEDANDRVEVFLIVLAHDVALWNASVVGVGLEFHRGGRGLTPRRDKREKVSGPRG